MSKLVLIVDNVRSSYNVGSLMRTADGLGLGHIYLTGYTPHPPVPNDVRMPHDQQRVLSQIQKTALGAEKSVKWSYEPVIGKVINNLKEKGYTVAALEQARDSKSLEDFSAPSKLAVVVGNEVEGLSQDVLTICDEVLEIPMKGLKESFNVTIAAAIVLYRLTYSS